MTKRLPSDEVLNASGTFLAATGTRPWRSPGKKNPTEVGLKEQYPIDIGDAGRLRQEFDIGA